MLFLLSLPEFRSLLTLVSSILILFLSAFSIIVPGFIWSWISSSFLFVLLYFAGVAFLMRSLARGGQYPDIQTANLEGQTFLVTGAASGIGKETALELAKHGARVVVFARRGNLAETISDVKKVARSPDNVTGYVLDLSDLQSIKSCIEEFMKNEDPYVYNSFVFISLYIL